MVAPGSGRGRLVSDIFREIDDELRRDNLLKLWAQYGRYIIALVIAALLIAGGVVLWRNHQQSEREAQSARYAAAAGLMQQDKDAEAAQVFGEIAREGGGYALLARFEQAHLLAKIGKQKEADAIYAAIAADGDVAALRDLARLLPTLQNMATAPAKATIAALKPLTEPGSPWRPTALELTALAEIKAGDNKAALDIYKGLADDSSTPPGLRARAAEMAAALTP
jgi:hypothetical protein